MNLLQNIIAEKRKEVDEKKLSTPAKQLEKGRFFQREPLSLKSCVLDDRKTGVIAEFKRKSPTKGVINNRHSVEAVTRAYMGYGASGISILTDYHFFGGSLDDLVAARDNDLPLLRKDFIIDEYQVLEAKAYGADAVLLIAACLQVEEVKTLSRIARNNGMEVLLEIHGEEELDHLVEGIDLVGINNRNLKTFEVNLEQGVKLVSQLGDDKVKIAESGINSVADVHYLKAHGFDGFLIGEYFMRQEDPAFAFKEFSYAL